MRVKGGVLLAAFAGAGVHVHVSVVIVALYFCLRNPPLVAVGGALPLALRVALHEILVTWDGVFVQAVPLVVVAIDFYLARGTLSMPRYGANEHDIVSRPGSCWWG